MDFPKSVPSVGLVDGKFVDEDPLTGTPGSLIPAAWGNSATLEMLNVIQAAGLAPSEVDLTQLLQAIRMLGQAGGVNFGNDAGATNVYSVTYAPAVPALANGLLLRFKAKTANTAGSTFSPNGLPAKALVGLALSALQGGEIVANGICSVVYSSVLDQWVLLECTGGALQVPAATKSQQAIQMGQATGRLLGVQIFTSSGIYTPTSGTTSVIVECLGAGGGGGGANAAGAAQVSLAGHGSGGAYAKARITSGFAGVAVTVGTGGAAGGTGGVGGSSGFGGLVSAAGGNGGGQGIGFAPPGSSGGSTAGGNTVVGGNIISSPGFPAAAPVAFSATVIFNIQGGQSFYGPGPSGGLGNGITATTKGTGGTGAAAGPSTGPFSGGYGAPGWVAVWEYA